MFDEPDNNPRKYTTGDVIGIVLVILVILLGLDVAAERNHTRDVCRAQAAAGRAVDKHGNESAACLEAERDEYDEQAAKDATR
jgi:hypothetical protein